MENTNTNVANTTKINKINPSNAVAVASELLKDELNDKSKKAIYGMPNGKFNDIANLADESFGKAIAKDLAKKLVVMKLRSSESIDTISNVVGMLLTEELPSGNSISINKRFKMNHGRGDAKSYIPTDETITDTLFAEMIFNFEQTKAEDGTSLNSYILKPAIKYLPAEISRVSTSELILSELMNNIIDTLNDIDLRLGDIAIDKLINAPTVVLPNDTVSKDTFECAVAIKKHIEKMRFGSDQYNIDASKLNNNNKGMLRSVKEDDLLILCSTNAYVHLMNQKSVIYNPSYWHKFNTDVGNIIALGDRITAADEYNTTIQTQTAGTPAIPVPYLDDKTVIVIEKNAVFITNLLKAQQSQIWNNFFTVHVMLIWVMINIVPFACGFKYTCDNLCVNATNFTK